jgi:hypothetical protein
MIMINDTLYSIQSTVGNFLAGAKNKILCTLILVECTLFLVAEYSGLF